MVKNIIVLRERMPEEGRVALRPADCLAFTRLPGVSVYVESGAGQKSGYKDADYFASGVDVFPLEEIIPMLSSPDTIVLKVKQPIPVDNGWFSQMRNGVLCAYFHSTGEDNRATIDRLLAQNITAISYENIRAKDDTLPLLARMSEIAGRLAVDWGLKVQSKKSTDIHMAVFGAGVAGLAAIKRGLQFGFSKVFVFDTDITKRSLLHREIKEEYLDRISFFCSKNMRAAQYQETIQKVFKNTDILVGTALVPGGHAPMVVSEQEMKLLPRGSVVVDVACDQGGCFWFPPSEVGKAHFAYDGKIFYRTPNMPGSVPSESTPAFAKTLLPYLIPLFDNKEKESVFLRDFPLQSGLLTHAGKVMNQKAADYWNEPYVDPKEYFSRG